MTEGSSFSYRAYRSEIDGLRAIAVSSVILYHAGLPFAAGGFVGVDIFFVISGFLITGIVYGEIRAGRFSLLHFYERRARRILPALFVMMAACLPAAWILLTPEQLRSFGQSLIAVSVFLSNHYFLLRTGYFSPGAQEIPLLHTWTLSVEEQFYILLPLAMLAVARFSPSLLKASLWIAGILSFLLSLRYTTTAPLLNFFYAAPRAWEFLLGSLLAVYLADRGGHWSMPRIVAQAGSSLGLGLIIVAIVTYSDATRFPGATALVPVAGATLVIATARPGTVAGRLLSLRPMVGLGLVSYSAYLWHQPVLAFHLAATGAEGSTSTLLGLLLLILVLSVLSWRFVELPARDRVRVSGRRVAVIAAVGTVAFSAIGLGVHLQRGLPSRFSAEQNGLAATAVPSPHRATCHHSAKGGPLPGDACSYFTEPVHWAVFGDSHAIEIAEALAERLRDAGVGGVLHLTKTGCQPAIGFESNVPGCTRWVELALARITGDPRITDVAVIYRHSFHLYGSQVKSFPRLPDSRPPFLPEIEADAARERYWRGFEAVVARLRAAGKRIWIFDPVPELGRHVEWYVYNHGMSQSEADRLRGPSRSYYAARQAFILDRLDRLPYGPGLVRLPTADALCEADRCLAGADGSLFYFDDNHLSMPGARRVVTLLAARGAVP